MSSVKEGIYGKKNASRSAPNHGKKTGEKRFVAAS